MWSMILLMSSLPGGPFHVCGKARLVDSAGRQYQAIGADRTQ